MNRDSVLIMVSTGIGGRLVIAAVTLTDGKLSLKALRFATEFHHVFLFALVLCRNCVDLLLGNQSLEFRVWIFVFVSDTVSLPSISFSVVGEFSKKIESLLKN